MKNKNNDFSKEEGQRNLERVAKETEAKLMARSFDPRKDPYPYWFKKRLTKYISRLAKNSVLVSIGAESDLVEFHGENNLVGEFYYNRKVSLIKPYELTDYKRMIKEFSNK